MKELQVQDKVYLEDWDIEVTPFLTVKEMELIIQHLSSTRSYLTQQQVLVGEVMILCTDILKKDENAQLIYEDIVYSGLWDAILEACPYLKECILIIWADVKTQQTLESTLCNLMDKTTDTINKIAEDKNLGDKLVKFLSKFAPKQE